MSTEEGKLIVQAGGLQHGTGDLLEELRSMTDKAAFQILSVLSK